MSTMTVRVHENTHRSLKELAGQTGQAMADILAAALEQYRRQLFLRGLAEDFADLRTDSAAWDEELRERQAWDATLAGDMESRARYTAHVARTAETMGWAWAYWQFDSDFIAYDIERDRWVEPIWKALVPGAGPPAAAGVPETP